MKQNWNDMLGSLEQDVEIPDVVKQKANAAFMQIKEETAQESQNGRSGQRIRNGHNDRDGAAEQTFMRQRLTEQMKTVQEQSENVVTFRPTGKRKMKPGRRILLGAAMIAAVGTLTVSAAAIMKWSQGIEEGMQVTPEDKILVENNNMAAAVAQTAESNGIKITAEQTIVDNYCCRIAFKIEGFDLPEGEEPSLGGYSITVDGNDLFSSSGGFYDGMVQGPDGRAIYADGTPIDYTADTIMGKYALEDGSLEYDLIAVNSEEPGFFINKPIHVELTDLGIVPGKAEHQTTVEGSWDFDWTTTGSNELRSCSINQELEGTGITVETAELSPVSWSVSYRIPKALQEEMIADQIEKEGNDAFWADDHIPSLTGALLKDGTMLPVLYGGPGGTAFSETDPELYTYKFVLDRIVNPDEIASLLFPKDYPEEGAELTIDHFYVIPCES